MKFKTIILILLIISTGTVFAQDGSSAKEQTIEQLFFQNIDVRIIKDQAESHDRDMKLTALQTIREKVKNGEFGEGDPAAHYVLEGLAEEGTVKIVIENKRMINYFPEVRRQACEVLGKLGGENSIKTLVQVVVTDIEPMVKAEAVYALGQIGSNENNDVTEAIAFALMNQNTDPDSNFAIASCWAFEKIAEANGGITDVAVFDALIMIAQGNYREEAKKKAHQVLKALQKY